jgi:hypothetical protein
MNSWRSCTLGIAVSVSACGSPTSPSMATVPGTNRARATWEGTLTRGGASATISLTLDEPAPATPNAFLLGAFKAFYPSVTYEGTAAAFTDRDEWSLNLMPYANRPCPVPLTTVHGTTVAVVTVTANRMSGEATLVECEGRTTWAAEFVRR